MKKILFVILTLFCFLIPIRAEEDTKLEDEKKQVEEYYSKIQDSSIAADNIYKAFEVNLTNGSILLDVNNDVEKRTNINKDILNGTPTRYSLYDIFGPDLNFIPYFGEYGIDMSLADHVYSAWKDNKLDQLTVNDVFHKSTTYLSTKAYPNRPRVLSQELVKQGFTDPRVQAVSRNYGTSNDYVWGSFFLNISKIIFSVISVFTDSSIYLFIYSSLKIVIESWIWKEIVVKSINVLLPITFLLYIARLSFRGKQYIQGEVGPGIKGMLSQFVVFIATLAFIFTTINYPNKILDVSHYLITKSDEISSFVFKPSDGYMKSDNLNNYLTQGTWNIVLFKPWVRGMFNDEYENLYTQYSTEGNKMDQSHDPSHTANEAGDKTYDSAYYTGDVYVPMGADHKERNWAAFALSTQSIYHKDIFNNEQESDISFPYALTSFGNRKLYSDTFRWLDAKLNISPEHGADKVVINTYTDSRLYESHFLRSGLQSFWHALLLATFLPLILIKIKYAILTYGTVFTTLSNLLSSLFTESSISIPIIELRDNIIKYLQASIKLLMAGYFYIKFIDKGFIELCIFIILMLVLCYLDAYTFKRDIQRVRYAWNDLTVRQDHDEIDLYKARLMTKSREYEINKNLAEGTPIKVGDLNFYLYRSAILLNLASKSYNTEYNNRRGLVTGTDGQLLEVVFIDKEDKLAKTVIDPREDKFTLLTFSEGDALYYEMFEHELTKNEEENNANNQI